MTGGARHKQGLVVRLAEGGAKDVVGDGGGGGGGGSNAGHACDQQVGGEGNGGGNGSGGSKAGCGDGVVGLA